MNINQSMQFHKWIVLMVEHLQSGKGVYQANARRRDRSSHQHNAHRHPCAILVTNSTKGEAHANIKGNRTNIGSPNVLRRKSEIFFDQRKEGGYGEPDEEGDEEGPPSKVEGSHVRARKRADLEFGSLVVLVRVDLECVPPIIFGLDFGALCMHMH